MMNFAQTLIVVNLILSCLVVVFRGGGATTCKFDTVLPLFFFYLPVYVPGPVMKALDPSFLAPKLSRRQQRAWNWQRKNDWNLLNRKFEFLICWPGFRILDLGIWLWGWIFAQNLLFQPKIKKLFTQRPRKWENRTHEDIFVYFVFICQFPNRVMEWTPWTSWFV